MRSDERRKTRRRGIRRCVLSTTPSNFPKLNKASIETLKTIWNGIRVNNNGIIHSKPIDRLSLRGDSKSISMYNYIPAPIRQEFEKTAQKGIEAHVDLPRGRKLHIYMLEPVSSSSQHPSITTQLNNVVAWFRYISTVAAPHCAKDLSVYILATDAKKTLPDDPLEPIDQIHANTAFTTACSVKNEIFIFPSRGVVQSIDTRNISLPGTRFFRLFQSNRLFQQIYPLDVSRFRLEN